MRFFVGLSAAALVTGFVIVACNNDDSPTQPTVAATAVPPPAATTNSGGETQPTVTPSPTPKPELPLWVSCDPATGICKFGTDKPRPVSAKCTKPAETDPFYGTWSAVINDGDTVDVRDICNKIEAEDCAPKTVPVQVDFQGMGRHLGHLGPLYQLTFPQKLSPEECEECKEWKEPKISTECGDYGECHPILAALTEVAPACEQERTCVETSTWNCKDPDIREYTESEPCDCPCIEGGPYPGLPLWMDANNPLEGQCEEEIPPLEPGVQTLNGEPEKNCHINGTQRIKYDCQDPETRFLCKNVECPCVEEWIEQEPVITTGDCIWNEDRQGCFEAVRTVITEINSCTQEERTKSDTTEYEECACEGECYYNVSGASEAESEATCLSQGGGDAAWNAGTQQCVIPVPGVCHEDFQLTPGQSHPACLKRATCLR